MRVHLIGTGSADRWPNPWCWCASCAWARSTGALRHRTSALIDDTLLVDPGPDAGGRGVELSGVRTVLITHDHPDHLDPAFLLAWEWASGAAARPPGPGEGSASPARSPLLVAGPREAIERCRHWIGPDAPVQLRSLGAGDSLRAGEHHVTALPAAHSTSGGHDYDATALLYEISGANSRILYATDTAALPHDHLTRVYDLVLLEQTFGDLVDHGTAHLDLPGFAREVTLLRAAGRLAPRARIVAVHLSHHNGPDLAQRLGDIGAELLPDGATITVGDGRERAGARAAETATRSVGSRRRLLVTGGARSGKSHYAESVVMGHPGAVTYVATAPAYPDDPEWQTRIAAHRARRPDHWRTVESTDVAGTLRNAAPADCVLVDCLTLWLTAVLDQAGWGHTDAAIDAAQDALDGLVEALRISAADVVLVTNEVGSGVVPDQPSGRLFRDLLGRTNVSVAATCSDVVLVTAGIPIVLKEHHE